MEPERKKSKIGIVILVVVILALLIGAGAGAFAYTQIAKNSSFSEAVYELCPGESRKIDLNKTDTYGIKWSSKNESVFTVSSNGTVTGGNYGTTTLTAKDGIFTYKCDITVREHSYEPATCTKGNYCTYCGAAGLQKPLGHTPSEATCTTPSICTVCNEKLSDANGHSFSDATCLEPQKCTVCGEIGKPALGHEFTEPTCVEPGKCIRCEKIGEEALGHIFGEATCLAPSTCERCGATEGDPLPHTPGKGVCLQPVICTVCQTVIKEAADHDYAPATCTKPKTCTRCKATTGSALGHTPAAPATCTAASKCARCQTVLQNKTGHLFVNADAGRICAYCGTPEGGSGYSSYSGSSSSGSSNSGSYTSDQDYINQVVALVNQEREAYGLSALATDTSLMNAAQTRSVEIVSTFSHTRPDGRRCFTAFTEAGYSGRTMGENIAAGQRSPEEVVTAWMNSEGHRANILNSSFTVIGVGFTRTDSSYRTYWVQAFGG